MTRVQAIFRVGFLCLLGLSSAHADYILDPADGAVAHNDGTVLVIPFVGADTVGFSDVRLRLEGDGTWRLLSATPTVAHLDADAWFDFADVSITVPRARVVLGGGTVRYFADVTLKVQDGAVRLAGARAVNTVSGTVTDAAAGTPVSGVLVWVASANQAAVTDDEGAFLLWNLPEGTHKVQLRNGAAVTDTDLVVGAGDNVRELAVPSRTTGALSVELTDAEGAPLTGTEVSVRDLQTLDEVARTTTNDSGRVSLDGLPAGAYLVAVLDGSGWQASIAETGVARELALETRHGPAGRDMQAALAWLEGSHLCVPTVAVSTYTVADAAGGAALWDAVSQEVAAARAQSLPYDLVLDGEGPGNYVLLVNELAMYRLVNRQGIVLDAGYLNGIDELSSYLVNTLHGELTDADGPTQGWGTDITVPRGGAADVEYVVDTSDGFVLMRAGRGSLAGDVGADFPNGWKGYRVSNHVVQGARFVDDDPVAEDYEAEVLVHSVCSHDHGVELAELQPFRVITGCEEEPESKWVGLPYGGWLFDSREYSRADFRLGPGDTVTAAYVSMIDWCGIGCTSVTFTGIDANGGQRSVTVENTQVTRWQRYSSAAAGLVEVTGIRVHSYEGQFGNMWLSVSDAACD